VPVSPHHSIPLSLLSACEHVLINNLQHFLGLRRAVVVYDDHAPWILCQHLRNVCLILVNNGTQVLGRYPVLLRALAAPAPLDAGCSVDAQDDEQVRERNIVHRSRTHARVHPVLVVADVAVLVVNLRKNTVLEYGPIEQGEPRVRGDVLDPLNPLRQHIELHQRAVRRRIAILPFEEPGVKVFLNSNDPPLVLLQGWRRHKVTAVNPRHHFGDGRRLASGDRPADHHAVGVWSGAWVPGRMTVGPKQATGWVAT